jgi:hypothetical protein
MIRGAHASGHPQSHTITRALALPARTPAATVPFASAMISAGSRFAQRGQPPGLWCDAQLVRFSDPLIVNTPAVSGTALNTCASAPVIHSRTSGRLVHIARKSFSRTPARSFRLAKNDSGIARGSFM